MTTIDSGKKFALYYFKDLFDKYYNFIQIDNDYETYSGLQDAIREMYETKYKGKYGADEAYDYVSNQLNRIYNIRFQDSKVIMISSVYDELIKNISKFSFKADHEGSFGDKQNKNTDKILFQLSLIRNLVFANLKEVDTKLSEELPHNDKAFIDNRLEEMLYLLLSSLNDLIYRRDEYNNAMKVAKGIDIPRFDDVNTTATVNDSLKNWKVARNGSLNNITRFVYKLDELIKVIYMNDNYTKYNFYRQGQVYNSWMNYINSSDNAYSYREPYRR